jgi:hypothetical protein
MIEGDDDERLIIHVAVVDDFQRATSGSSIDPFTRSTSSLEAPCGIPMAEISDEAESMPAMDIL